MQILYLFCNFLRRKNAEDNVFFVSTVVGNKWNKTEAYKKVDIWKYISCSESSVAN